MTSRTSTVSRRAPLSVRVAAALLLGIVTGASPSLALAQGPAKGTEILWDRYGVPHIFAPDHASLFYAYGYAQMEAHSELLLRLYAQARGRGAEFYGEHLPRRRSLGAHQRHSRDARRSGPPGRAPSSAPLIAAFVRGLERLGGRAQGRAQRRGAARAAGDASRTSTRTACASSTTTGSSIRRSWRRGSRAPTSRRTAPTNGPSRASRSATGKAMLMSNSHLQWGDIHTYFEVQLTAPGVTSYGAVWVGFPVLRQCFTEYVGWTQTTNNPAESDLYRLVLKDGGYVLDGQVKPVRDAHRDHQGAQKPTARCATCRSTVRRSVHGPIVAERDGAPIAMRVAAIDRPRLFEQFWKMGLAKNLAEWQDGMRMQQLPLFNTAYADRDGHIAYVYNATLPVHPTGDYRFWQGVVPGDRSDLIATDDRALRRDLRR